MNLSGEPESKPATAVSAGSVLDRAFSAYNRGDFSAAKADFETYLQMAGDREVPLRYLAQIAANGRDYTAARIYLLRADAAAPQSIETLIALSDIEFRLRMPEEARKRLELVLQIDPFHERSLSALAELAERRKDRRAAMVYYRRLLVVADERSANPGIVQKALTSLAQYSYEQGDVTKAAHYYEKLRDLDSEDTRTRFVLAELYKMSGRMDDSEALMTSMLEEEAEWLPGWESLAETQFITGSAGLNQTLAVCRKLQSQSPIVTAIQHFRAGRMKEADQFFRELIQDQKHQLAGYIALYGIADRSKDTENAKKHGFAVVVLARRVAAYELAHRYMGQVFRYLDIEEARLFPAGFRADAPASDAALRYILDRIEAHSAMAEISRSLGRPGLAQQHFLRGLRLAKSLSLKLREPDALPWLAPDDRIAAGNALQQKTYAMLLDIAWLQQGMKNPDFGSARRYLQEARDLKEEEYTGWFLSGVLELNDLKPGSATLSMIYLNKAREAWSAAESKKAPPANLDFYTGMAWEKNGDFPAAEPFFREAIRKDPFNTTYLNYLGYLLSVRNEKLQDAEAFLITALEEDPENEAYLDSLGWIYYRQGRFEIALEKLVLSMNHASRKNITDSVVFLHLAETYMSLKQYASAAAYFERTLEYSSEASEPIDVNAVRQRLQNARDLHNGIVPPEGP